MMRDYAKKPVRRKTTHSFWPTWIVIALLLMLGLLFDLRNLQHPIKQLSSIKPITQRIPTPKIQETDQNQSIQFDFYHLLPKATVNTEPETSP